MKYLLVGLSFLMSTAALAQNVLNAKSPEELREQRANKLVVNEAGDSISTEVEPLSYGFIEDKDIIWSKVVWETIDLINHILKKVMKSFRIQNHFMKC